MRGSNKSKLTYQEAVPPRHKDIETSETTRWSDDDQEHRHKHKNRDRDRDKSGERGEKGRER